MADINARVFKYNPGVDAESTYAEYAVPWYDSITVLEVLRYIHENFEPAAFDYSCRGASCGMCTMKINGVPGFACATLVMDGADLTIDPLDRFPIIRDVIVDKSAVKARMLSVSPGFIRETPMENPLTMTPESFKATGILQQCRECMICQSMCPVVEREGFEKYVGPYIMTRLASRYFDEREGKQAERLQTAVREGLFNCDLCGTCTSVCPKGSILKLDEFEYSFIDHVRYFTKMREDATAQGLAPVAETPVRPIPMDMSVSELVNGVPVLTDIQREAQAANQND